MPKRQRAPNAPPFRSLPEAVRKTFHECFAATTPAFPTLQTPKPETPGAEVPERSFKSMQDNDRKAAITHIQKLMAREEAWASWTLKQRMQLVFRGYDELISMREINSTSRAAKQDYPEKYDREGDLKFIVCRMVEYLKEPEKKKTGMAVAVQDMGYAMGREDDDDDEVPLPANQGAKVKKEGVDCDDEAEEQLQAEIREKTAALDSMKKRKATPAEAPAAKKSKTEVRAGTVASESESTIQVGSGKVIFSVASRGMAISRLSGLTRRLSVGHEDAAKSKET